MVRPIAAAVLISGLLSFTHAQTNSSQWDVSDLWVSLSPEDRWAHRPKGPTRFSITIDKAVGQNVTCTQSWDPPAYPRGWIACESDPTLFYRFWNATKAPNAAFFLEIAEISTQIVDKNSVVTFRNASFFTTNNSPGDPDAYLGCLSPPTGMPISCELGSAISNGRHPVLKPSQRQISLANTIQLGSLSLKRATNASVSSNKYQLSFSVTNNILKDFLGGLGDAAAARTYSCVANYALPVNGTAAETPVYAQCDDKNVPGLTASVTPIRGGAVFVVSHTVQIAPGKLYGGPLPSGNETAPPVPIDAPLLYLSANATAAVSFIPVTSDGLSVDSAQLAGPIALERKSIWFTAANSTA